MSGIVFPSIRIGVKPPTTVIMPSVTMMEGMRLKATSAPLSRPIAAPAASIKRMLAVGEKCPFVAAMLVTAAVKPMVAPTEMSISRHRITRVMPQPTMAIGAMASNMSRMLPGSKNGGSQATPPAP